MAQWVAVDWRIDARPDLDAYTYSVAGAVGVLLCDLCAWHDGVQADRRQAIALGRGLQAVNILRNRSDDRARGVDFYPLGWTDADLATYAREHLVPARAYLQTLPPCAVQLLCSIPLALALATLDALAAGAPKLSRAAVRDIVAALSPSPEASRPDHSPTEA
jgi:farnesyl-diphosphate farnesyltransferase